ncbi:MAG: polyprenyl synthetase family protein [SAR324 cluster bacterium]|nr:polyprenyl synthetase family protein [SAR324 cluster bacterium]
MKNTDKNFLKERTLIDDYLKNNLPTTTKYGQSLLDSMKYSLLSNGKRIRPILFLRVVRAANIDQEKFLSFAGAIEAMHCYTLIHDDLPLIDDDDLRRGKPTNHKLFGDATALLAGDALLSLCFEFAAQPLPIEPKLQLMMIKKLACLGGSKGLVVGQQVDIEAEKMTNQATNSDILEFIHHHKTGALILASIETAAIATKVSAKTSQILNNLAYYLGLHFQITDDILEFISSEDIIGKDTFSDRKNSKLTYPKLYGIDLAKKKSQNCFNKIIKLFNSLPAQYHDLLDIINYMSNRQR